MTTLSSSNSGMFIGVLIVAIAAIGGYAIYQHNHHTVKIELPGATAKIQTQ